MVNKLTLAILYLSALALAHPSNVRRQDDGLTDVSGLLDKVDIPGLPEGSGAPEIPAPEDPFGKSGEFEFEGQEPGDEKMD